MVFVDLRALRNDRVTLVEKGSPHSLCLMESGKVCKIEKFRHAVSDMIYFDIFYWQNQHITAFGLNDYIKQT